MPSIGIIIGGSYMIDRCVTALIAKLRIKRLIWPNADDPNFLEKITRKQRQEFRLPPSGLVRGLIVEHTKVNNYDCVTISPKQVTAEGRVLLIHGGAFVLPINRLHWRLAADLVRRSGMPVTVPCYPFVPQHNFSVIHDHILKVYDTILDVAAPTKVSIVGDSAGANLALVLPLLVSLDKQPGSVIALSPVVDMRVSNTLIDSLEPADPLLPLDAIHRLLPAYYERTIATDPRVSPLFADYSHIKSNLYILNGGKDLLSADIDLFHKELVRQKVYHHYVFEKYLPHAWPIFPLFSSKKSRKQIADWCKVEGVR